MRKLGLEHFISQHKLEVEREKARERKKGFEEKEA